MFKQQVNRLGFFIQSLNNVRNITDGVFGYGVKNARLGFKGRDQLIMGRTRFFYRFINTFAVFVKQCTDFAAAFDDRGRQAVQFSCWLLRISSNSIALFRVLVVEFSKACDWLRRLSFNALVRLTTSSDERRVASICSFKRLTAPVASSSMMLEALINSSIWRFSSPLISSILVTEPLIWRCC